MMEKRTVREYRKGNPKQYKNAHLSPHSHEKLQKLSKVWKMSLLQVLEKIIDDAAEKLQPDQPKGDD